MARRTDGRYATQAQADDSYRLEEEVTVSGYVTTWVTVSGCGRLTLKQAERRRRDMDRVGRTSRIRHESEY